MAIGALGQQRQQGAAPFRRISGGQRGDRNGSKGVGYGGHWQLSGLLT
jgi:hypothetical protein